MAADRFEADFGIAAFLRPERWNEVASLILTFRERAAWRRVMSTFRERLAAGHLGLSTLLVPSDIEIVGSRVPPAKVTSDLVEQLRLRRESYYHRRHLPIPTELEGQPAHDEEEEVICAAIKVTLEYANGGPEPMGRFDLEIDAVAESLLAVDLAIEASVKAVERIGATAAKSGRVLIPVYAALVALKAAEAALNNIWPYEYYSTAGDEREVELERVVRTLEKVKPLIPRKLIAKWLTEVGLAKHNEHSLNTVIHRIRKSGGKLPRRKKHTTTED